MKKIVFPLLSSTLLALSLYADKPSNVVTDDSFKQSEIVPAGVYAAGYNAPAQVKLLGGAKSWLPDVFASGSFLYYMANEDGLDIGTSGAIIPDGGQPVVGFTSNAQVALPDFGYKPSFKVGLGTRLLEWTLAAEYTWIRNNTYTSKDAPSSQIAGTTGVWTLNDWYEQTTTSGQSMAFSNFDSHWHLRMDIADVMLSRAFYQGRRVCVTPMFGVRGAWIRQRFNLKGDVPSTLVTSKNPGDTWSRNSSHSWGVGPRAAVEVDCLLGMGFRLEGEVGTSLLFTQYTNVRHSENVANAAAVPQTLTAEFHDYNCVRPIGELGLGIGWGSYLADQKYHIDLSASYDFMLFWNQNMMRKLLDTVNDGVGGAAGGDLSLNGLTFTARFDF